MENENEVFTGADSCIYLFALYLLKLNCNG